MSATAPALTAAQTVLLAADDLDALYASVLADPADDTPRLVYADWLDEHGQPERAEFIRLQIEIARRPIGSAEADESAVRLEALRESYARTWSEELPALDGLKVREWQRGMLFSVNSDSLDDFRRH